MKKLIIEVVAVAAVLGGFYLFVGLPSRNAAMEKTRTRLVDELQSFSDFDEHEVLLLETIDQHHERVYRRHVHVGGSRYSRQVSFDWRGYRAKMYRLMRSALAEAGDVQAGVRLDRHQSRHAPL